MRHSCVFVGGRARVRPRRPVTCARRRAPSAFGLRRAGRPTVRPPPRRRVCAAPRPSCDRSALSCVRLFTYSRSADSSAIQI
ncbi:hypothetical protein EVAR_76281_1 [Eumeta japonica]|uniref:Uncharacterized protein n=1 Tax=Eumeta variegata TaxID=151549 RepID=A0A4C1UQC5_EUMVA|nr:hypothetical protein EVAR_76281_1 [Eumeta japonica]